MTLANKTAKEERRNKKKAALIAILIILLVLTTILYWISFHSLRCEIVSGSLQNISLGGADISVKLKVVNQGVVPVYVSSTSFDLFVNDAYVGSGSSGGITVGLGGERIVSVSVSFSWMDLALTLAELIKNHEEVTLKIVGEGHLLLLNVPFMHSKNIQF